MTYASSFEEKLWSEYQRTIAQIETARKAITTGSEMEMKLMSQDINNAGRWKVEYAKLWREKAENMLEKLNFMMDKPEVEGDTSFEQYLTIQGWIGL